MLLKMVLEDDLFQNISHVLENLRLNINGKYYKALKVIKPVYLGENP